MVESSQAAKRPPEAAKDDEWKHHMKKGAGLVSRMENGPYGTSRWKYNDIKDQDWKQEGPDDDKKPFLSGPMPRANLAGVLKLLHVSHKDEVEGGRNRYQLLRYNGGHLKKIDYALVENDYKYGRLANSFNPEDGVIICHRNFKSTKEVYAGSARGKVKVPTPGPIRWSDLIFLQWEHFAKSANCDVRNLRYVFRNRIDNEQTLRIITRAIKATTSTSSATQASGDFRPRKWPGHTFRTDSDEGRALLGTQNAKGIARGIIDRHEKYDGMVIEEIQVFLDDPPPSSPNEPMTCMLIRIVNKGPKQETPKAPVPSQQKVEAADKKTSKVGKALKKTKGKMKEINEGCKGQSG